MAVLRFPPRSELLKSLEPSACVAPERGLCITARVWPSFSFCFEVGNAQADLLQRRGLWEAGGTAVVTHTLAQTPDALVLDVGANFGWFSTLAAVMGHRVLALEPSRRFQCFATLNTLRNNVTSRVALFGHGADRQPRELWLREIEMQGEHRAPGSDMVSTIKIDSLLPFVAPNARLVVKMDIESFECEALLGATHLLGAADVRLLLMEWQQAGAPATRRGCNWDRAFATLRRAHLQPYRLKDSSNLGVVGFDMRSYIDEEPLSSDWRAWPCCMVDIAWLPKRR